VNCVLEPVLVNGNLVSVSHWTGEKKERGHVISYRQGKKGAGNVLVPEHFVGGKDRNSRHAIDVLRKKRRERDALHIFRSRKAKGGNR